MRIEDILPDLSEAQKGYIEAPQKVAARMARGFDIQLGIDHDKVRHIEAVLVMAYEEGFRDGINFSLDVPKEE